ncbi:MAG: hypothetical protein RLZZ444_2119 [Pseudomonadota bacterium]|jgi:CRP/FNR family transcriptional regulator
MLLLAHNEAFVPPALPLPAAPAPRARFQQTLSARQSFCFDKQEAGGFYRLTSGCLALSQYLPDGRRQIVDFVGPGRLFGFCAFGPNGTIAESLTISTFERIAADGGDNLQDELSAMLWRMQNHALLLGRKTAMERVASAMLDLSRQFARPGRARLQMAFTLYPTRADLADWLGLTVETVSRCLNAMKRDRLIDFTRPELVTIRDMPRLLEASGATAVTKTA